MSSNEFYDFNKFKPYLFKCKIKLFFLFNTVNYIPNENTV